MSPPWEGRRVLVTGHTGFKGAWLTAWLQHLGADVVGASLPPENPRGAYGCLSPWSDLREFIVDLRDAAEVERVVTASQPEVVFHLAAQALVRRGYQAPVETFATNVMGTVHLLEALATLDGIPPCVVATSDKVYANDGTARVFKESDPLGGIDPYSTSKACVELIAAAFRARFGISLATGRAGNVIGGGDMGPDRLLPDIRRSIQARKPVRIRNAEATRPWQHVLDPLRGYLLLAEALMVESGSTLQSVNFAPPPDSCITVLDLVEHVLREVGGGEWEPDDGPQPSEAPHLALDAGLARSKLGWRPVVTLNEAVRWTVDWWAADDRGESLRSVVLAQIQEYERLERA